MATQNQYAESSIKILEGLEPVKQRPGQFTRTDCPLHIVQEVLDNAVDEALGGFATKIGITFNADGSVTVTDNGRGIPVGLHPEKKIPVVQAVFTILYSGGKFDKKAGGGYSFSGGLHGVGVSVTNALSDLVKVEVRRDGFLHSIEFQNGDVSQPLKRLGACEGDSGTCVTVKPNPKYFDSPDIPFDQLRQLLKSKAVLLPGLTATLTDARGEEAVHEQFFFERGLATFLAELSDSALVSEVLTGECYASEQDLPFAPGEGCAWAFAWYEGSAAEGASFVNLIPTPQGGTHVAGLKSALYACVKGFVEHHGMMPKGLKLTADDVFKNVRYVLSGRMLDPSFDNQTKDRLNSRDGLKLVERMVQPSVEAWLNANPSGGRVIAELALYNASSRSRAAQKTERKRSTSVVMLPGKLSDCDSSDASLTELFLVEGDSAGGSAKMGRDKEHQATLALRGKGLNVWEKSKADALENAEIRDIATALGVAPHTLEETVDLKKLRYGKICILSDADVDGCHIQVLLLTLFLRHFPQLVAGGHIFIAKPPLYRIDVEASGKKRPAKKLYAMDEGELQAQEERLRAEGYTDLRIGRFKGLGEMNPPELWETTLCPDTRRLLPVSIPPGQQVDALLMFDNLMNKSKADWRRTWMEQRGNEISDY